jgi:MYND finger
MASSNEDNIGTAVDLFIAGKMNLERFKKLMPYAYANLWRNHRFNSVFAMSLEDQILTLAQTKLMVHLPDLLTQKIRYRLPNKPEKLDTLNNIFGIAMVVVGLNPMPGLTREYMSNCISNHLDRRCEMFSPTNGNDNNQGFDNDNRILSEIFFEAYGAAAYQLQEEIDVPIDQVFTHLHNPSGFVQEIIKFLEHCVTLPAQVATAHELVKVLTNFQRAQAVIQSFRKTIYVVNFFPDFYKCLQCWVCQANQTHLCASCKVAAFCGTTCQRSAWKRNHKKFCPHFQRIQAHAQAQCQTVAKVHKQYFIPGSRLVPNQHFDYLLVTISAWLEAAMLRSTTPLRTRDQMPSMDQFYENMAMLATDDQSFRTLFKNQSDEDHENTDNPTRSIIDVCVGLLYNGSPPVELLTIVPRLTRDAFLKEYKTIDGYPPQSEEMVMASVTNNLFTCTHAACSKRKRFARHCRCNNSTDGE